MEALWNSFSTIPPRFCTPNFFWLILFSVSWIILYFFQNWFISSSFWVVGVCSFRFYNGIYYYLIIISYYVATWYRLGIGWKIPIPIPIPIPRISTDTDTDTDTWKLIWTDTDTNRYRYQGFQPIPILTDTDTKNFNRYLPIPIPILLPIYNWYACTVVKLQR